MALLFFSTSTSPQQSHWFVPQCSLMTNTNSFFVPWLLPKRFHTVRNAGGKTFSPDVPVGLPQLFRSWNAHTSSSPQVVGLLLPNQTLASTIFWQVSQPPNLLLRVLGLVCPRPRKPTWHCSYPWVAIELPLESCTVVVRITTLTTTEPHQYPSSVWWFS